MNRAQKVLSKFLDIDEASKKLPKIVKVLRSSDFGMSLAGGNGDASAKGGNLVLKEPYFYSNQKRFDNYEKDWIDKQGTYAKYFRDEFNVKFKLVSKNDYRTKKMWDLPGYFEVVLSVLDI